MASDKNPAVDQYFIQGCMRCPHGGTPACKVHLWPEALQQLRMIALEAGLTEELKWGVPCYTHQGRNIAIVSAFTDHCSISFFKGVLLKDPVGILEKPGPNSQSARVVRFTTAEGVLQQAGLLVQYLQDAKAVEEAGLKVAFKQADAADYPEELVQKMDEDPAFKSAFEALTPGRQRGYLLHFSGAKQPKTRVSRIEKSMEKIFAGKGFQER